MSIRHLNLRVNPKPLEAPCSCHRFDGHVQPGFRDLGFSERSA